MIVASFLVFMLVHQRAVCNELYPISVVEDIAQNQPEWSTDNDIEPLQGKTYDQSFPASNLPQSDFTNQQDLAWIKTNIVDRYRFEKDPARDIWISQPDFKTDLGTPDFVSAADRVKAFFDRNNDWEKTKTNTEFRTEASCTNLLYITAARYLLVTHILYVKSLEIVNGGQRSRLIPCERTVDKKFVIPGADSGVCYPAPYGSATCTSDYDVGLIGKDAGFLTEKFNAYFQGVGGFRKPSELVFDTNVYAFTLEFAMPFMFTKLPGSFVKDVQKNEETINFRMQELASAYYKVFKYNEGFFNTLVNKAKEAMTATKSKAELNKWLNTFNTLRAQVPFKLGGGTLKTLDDFRTAHNNKYQELVKTMSAGGGYKSNFLGNVAEALIYAAEAYHTRGAIRHVVGGTQMKVIDTSPKTPLSTTDLWVSIIENWGESNKEYEHCKQAPLEECFLKMSKYMWRVFNAMRLVRDRIPASQRAGLVHFGEEKYANPELAMKMWLDYKKQGRTAIPRQSENVKQFLRQFGCDKAVESFGSPFSSTCISKMNDKVNGYNVKLAGLLTDEPVKPPWRY
ncbi:uncharacterized protein LOC144646184 [Oculina patagonica]